MQKLPLYPSPSKALHLNQLYNKITITQRTENYNNTTNIDFFFCILLFLFASLYGTKQRKNHSIILVLQFYIKKEQKRERKEVKRSITL